MTVKEIIRELQKMPQDMEVKYAVEKGKGRRTVYGINAIENYEGVWVILKFAER